MKKRLAWEHAGFCRNCYHATYFFFGPLLTNQGNFGIILKVQEYNKQCTSHVSDQKTVAKCSYSGAVAKW